MNLELPRPESNEGEIDSIAESLKGLAEKINMLSVEEQRALLQKLKETLSDREQMNLVGLGMGLDPFAK